MARIAKIEVLVGLKTNVLVFYWTMASMLELFVIFMTRSNCQDVLHKSMYYVLWCWRHSLPFSVDLGYIGFQLGSIGFHVF